MEKKIKDKAPGVRSKLFINSAGKTLICKGRLDFLEALDACGSIKQAAETLGISYRKAWGLVERTNQAAGRMIVEKLKGRSGNGTSARLTEEGRRLIKAFRVILELNQKFTAKLTREFNARFLPPPEP